MTIKEANKKLQRLKVMAARWGDKELGFQYFVDKKARLYPKGEFHHQSGDIIKAAFKIRQPDGTYTSLKNSAHSRSSRELVLHSSSHDLLQIPGSSYLEHCPIAPGSGHPLLDPGHPLVRHQDPDPFRQSRSRADELEQDLRWLYQVEVGLPPPQPFALGV